MLVILKLIIILIFLLMILLNIYFMLKIHLVQSKHQELEYYIEEAKKIIEKENK